MDPNFYECRKKGILQKITAYNGTEFKTGHFQNNTNERGTSINSKQHTYEFPCFKYSSITTQHFEDFLKSNNITPAAEVIACEKMDIQKIHDIILHILTQI